MHVVFAAAVLVVVASIDAERCDADEDGAPGECGRTGSDAFADVVVVVVGFVSDRSDATRMGVIDSCCRLLPISASTLYVVVIVVEMDSASAHTDDRAVDGGNRECSLFSSVAYRRKVGSSHAACVRTCLPAHVMIRSVVACASTWK